ncbi:hypothetical protein IMSAGC008_02061 [Muribaculaceae bacterium]|nr:hypothetical protein IMSAGC008_02061 [Muribaculaceae bacterium]
MGVGGHRHKLLHGNIAPGDAVERLQKAGLTRIKLIRKVDVRHHKGGIDSGIGTSGAGNGHRAAHQR